MGGRGRRAAQGWLEDLFQVQRERIRGLVSAALDCASHPPNPRLSAADGR